jgi:pilus assembly protein Flp/PilA
MWYQANSFANSQVGFRIAQGLLEAAQPASIFSFGSELEMRDIALKLYASLRVLKSEDGQDLIEYALVVALVALAATAGMNSLASGINTAFNNLGTRLTNIIP